MRYTKIPCILRVCVPWLVLCWGVSQGLAAEDPEPAPAPMATVPLEQKEQPVSYGTKGKYFLGYRFVSSEESPKAAEYIYPHSSATFGMDVLSCPLPYRYHVNAEFLSSYDFYTDAGFAYKDLILFRDILVGVHHNHDHYSYQYAGEPGAITYNDRNPADSYHTDFTSNLLSLRLKAPDFPTHAFVSHRHVEQDGRIQEQFLLGDRTVGSMVSESRDIDWKSNALKLGANSHAGPLEVEYAYDMAEFVPGRHNILYDSYPASGSRPADTYPHGVVPETESSANSIKLHSSYTGGIVTAATLSNLSEKNNYSQTESSTWKGAFDCSWIPDPLVGVFFKYRHRNVTTDTPDTITLSGLSNTLNYPVRQGLSYDKDVFSLSGRYKPVNMLSLFATYEFSYLDRNDVAEWVALPGQSSIHSTNLTAHLRPLAKIKVTASYDYKNYTDPSYNTSPDSSNQLRLSTTYTPLSWLTAYLEYLIALSQRDSLRYINVSPSLLLETGERQGQRDQLLASLTTTLSPQVSVTASWFYQHWKVKQDLAYGKLAAGGGGGDLPYIDTAVPYTDESNSLSLSLQWLPRADITMVAGISHTLIEGRTGYDDMVGGAPFSLDSFSAVKAEESIFSLEITRMLSKEWEIGLSSSVDIYNDRESGHLDGNAVSSSFRIKRYF